MSPLAISGLLTPVSICSIWGAFSSPPVSPRDGAPTSQQCGWQVGGAGKSVLFIPLGVQGLSFHFQFLPPGLVSWMLFPQCCWLLVSLLVSPLWGFTQCFDGQVKHFLSLCQRDAWETPAPHSQAFIVWKKFLWRLELFIPFALRAHQVTVPLWNLLP